MSAHRHRDAVVTVVGEALIDRVRSQDGQVSAFPGGNATNVAVAVGRLGVPVRLITELGDDEDGNLLRTWLRQSDVEVLASPSATGRTSSAAARIDPNGAAEYEFDISWTLAEMALPPTQILHVGSIAASLAPGADTVADLMSQAAGATVTFDPNVRPSITPDRAMVRSRSERIVASATLVKASTEDLQWLYPEATPMESARSWLDAGPALVVVTHAEGGATALSRSFEVHTPAVAVDVVDTVGAGDTFTGALLAQIALNGIELLASSAAVAEALRQSALAASITVSRAGANPPWGSEVPGIFASSPAGGRRVSA
jgi:fructokinase